MSVDGGFRVKVAQVPDETLQGGALCRGAGICRTHGCVATPYVAYSDRIGIVPLAVRSRQGDVPPFHHGAVECNYKMIADAVESSGAMPSVDFPNTHVASCRCGGAVDYYFIDFSHNGAKLQPTPWGVHANLHF